MSDKDKSKVDMNMSLEGADSKALRAAVEGLKEKFTFGVAIDGSSMSFKALDLVCKLITERAEGKAPKVEKLHCLHVENPHKQEALSLKSEHFRHTAKLRIDKEPHIEMRWHHSHVDKSSRDSEGHVGIFSLLEGMAMEHGLDLLVVGTFGLNGEKGNRIGRMSSFSMANSQTPVFIVKPSFLPLLPSQQRGYFFAMDGLSASSKALIFVTKYLMRKQDKIYLFYKNTHAEVKGIFKNYMELLGGLGLNY